MSTKAVLGLVMAVAVVAGGIFVVSKLTHHDPPAIPGQGSVTNVEGTDQDLMRTLREQTGGLDDRYWKGTTYEVISRKPVPDGEQLDIRLSQQLCLVPVGPNSDGWFKLRIGEDELGMWCLGAPKGTTFEPLGELTGVDLEKVVLITADTPPKPLTRQITAKGPDGAAGKTTDAQRRLVSFVNFGAQVPVDVAETKASVKSCGVATEAVVVAGRSVLLKVELVRKDGKWTLRSAKRA